MAGALHRANGVVRRADALAGTSRSDLTISDLSVLLQEAHGHSRGADVDTQ
jgi:hypothetical protein